MNGPPLPNLTVVAIVAPTPSAAEHSATLLVADRGPEGPPGPPGPEGSASGLVTEALGAVDDATELSSSLSARAAR